MTRKGNRSYPLNVTRWGQGMMGGAQAHCDGIVAFLRTDFTEDLKEITVLVLVQRWPTGFHPRVERMASH